MRHLATQLLLLTVTLSGQTVINGGRTIQGDWDASGAASTKPARTGAALPAACRSGEMFFLTTAAAGENLNLCQPDNTWTRVAPAGGAAGAVGSQSNTFAAGTTQVFHGTLDASAATATMPAATGAALPASCVTGQLFLKTGGDASRMLFACSSTNTWTQTAHTQGTLAERPSACSAGALYIATDASAGQNLSACTSTNTWTTIGSAGGLGGSGTANQVAYFSGSSTLTSDNKITRTSSGDLTVTGSLSVAGGASLTQYSTNAAWRLFFGAIDYATCAAGVVTISSNYTTHRIQLNNQTSCAVTYHTPGSMGQLGTVILCHGNTTPTTTVTWTGAKGGMTGGGTAGQCAGQSFVYDTVNTVWQATSGGSSWN